MYESYRARIKKILMKLPDDLIVHYIDKDDQKHTTSADDLLLYLVNAHRDGDRHAIKHIEPADLIAIEAKNNILSILLLTDGYKPATHVIKRDRITGELHEMTEEELEAQEKELDAMTEAERSAYWRREEQAFFEYFGKSERGEE